MNRVVICFFLCAASLQAADAPPPVKGRLCFVEKGTLTQCSSTTGTQLVIAEADVSRPFVWTSDDGKRIVAGIAEPKSDSIDLEAKEWREITLSVSGERSREWPLETRFLLGTPERPTWMWTVPPKLISRLATLSVPQGRYRLMVSAGHHIDFNRSLDLSSKARLELGEIRLTPLPIVSGVVVTKKDDEDVPLGGATISFPGGEPLATSDEGGRFQVEIGPARRGQKNDALLVSRPGFAQRLFVIGHQPADIHLGMIRLVAGTTLKVHFDRPALQDRKLTVELLRKEKTRWEHTSLVLRDLQPYVDAMEFEDLEPAVHYIVVRGKTPFELLSRRVEVEEGKPASTNVEIVPFRLEGRVRMGGQALTDAALEIGPEDQSWRAAVSLQNDGTFTETMWQHGRLKGGVMNFQKFGAASVTSPELGADPSIWNIEIVKRMISGRVLDEVTRRPMTDVGLDLVAELANGGSKMSIVNLDTDQRLSYFVGRSIGGGGGSRTRVRKQWQPGYYMLVSPLDLVRRLSGEREPPEDQPLDLVTYA